LLWLAAAWQSWRGGEEGWVFAWPIEVSIRGHGVREMGRLSTHTLDGANACSEPPVWTGIPCLNNSHYRDKEHLVEFTLILVGSLGSLTPRTMNKENMPAAEQ